MDTTDTFRFLQSEVSRLRDENRQLKDELAIAQSSVHALCSLQELLERMTPEQDVIDLLNDILASAMMVVGASDGSLLLLDDDTQELVFAVVLGEARGRLKGFRLPPRQGHRRLGGRQRQARRGSRRQGRLTLLSGHRRDDRFQHPHASVRAVGGGSAHAGSH